MNFSLIICTYNRRKAIEVLMNSIVNQSLYPNQIIIVDGSLNQDTKAYFESNPFKNLDYFLIDSTKLILLVFRLSQMVQYNRRLQILSLILLL